MGELFVDWMCGVLAPDKAGAAEFREYMDRSGSSCWRLALEESYVSG